MPFPIFDKQADIPKGSEDVYEEKDGKWHPKLVDASKLETTLTKVRDEKDAAEKRAKKAEDERADLERKLTAAGSGDEKDKVTKALAKFDTDLAAEKAKHEKELGETKAQLRTLKLDDAAKAAFIKAGGRPEKADAALKLQKDSLDLADDGRIVVKDAKGVATTETIDDYWGKTFKKDMPEFFTGTKAAGGGAGGGAGARPIPANGDGKWDGDAVLADPLGALNAANLEAAAATK